MKVTPRSECVLFTLDVVTTTTRPEQGGVRGGRRGNRGYLVAAVILLAVAVTAVLVGARTDPSKVSGAVDTSHLKVGPAAPAVDSSTWINSPPLSQADLRGKVVLYDFWTYSCVNCVRTFPSLRAWFDRYTRDGLVVIGIHSPEFDFEKVTKNVEAAVKRDAVTWPVALDNDMTIWKRFDNQYWPADYIADRRGRIRYTHFGEGDYTNTENVLRTLLGVRASSPRAAEVTPEVARLRRDQPRDVPRAPVPDRPSRSSTCSPVPATTRRPRPASIAPPRVAGGDDHARAGQDRGRARRQVDRGARVGHVRRGRRDDPHRRARQGGQPRDGDGDAGTRSTR